MKKILVAGGAGFIGSHLCENLINQGHHVTCLDKFFTGNRRKVESLIDNPNFELIDHDVIEPYSNTVD